MEVYTLETLAVYNAAETFSDKIWDLVKPWNWFEKETIGKQLNIPVESKSIEETADHFGWFAGFAGLDCPASSKITREQLGWNPLQTTLLADMEQGTYFNI